MKSEIYNALAGLNRGFDAALESLKALQQEGVVAIEYVQAQTEMIEEIRADSIRSSSTSLARGRLQTGGTLGK